MFFESCLDNAAGNVWCTAPLPLASFPFPGPVILLQNVALIALYVSLSKVDTMKLVAGVLLRVDLQELRKTKREFEHSGEE